LFWRHVVAAAESIEDPGNEQYQDRHMDAIFEEGFSFSGFERDYLALSLGEGQFLDVSGVSGLDSISDGRGSVFADFDNDGDVDVLLTALQGESHYLYRNNVGNRNGFLRVTLEGTTSGRDAFGAVVRVKTSAGILTKIKSGGSGFISAHDPRLLFGLGDDAQAEWVEVTWPGGAVERFAPVASGSSIRIAEGGSDPSDVTERRFALVDPLDAQATFLARIGLGQRPLFPDLKLTGLDGEPTQLSRQMQPGKKYLVNFWATYCVPCAEEMPELQAMNARFAAQGIEVLGISVDTETADQVPAYLAAKGVRYPIFTTDEASIAQVYRRGEIIIPTSFLLDGQRRVLDVVSGWTADSRKAVHDWAGKAAQ
jgi:thiol-disulfide isomerase/thioredoxin